MADTVQPKPTAALDLTKYAWLSIATGIAVFSLKLVAFKLTGSVGLLSDALESTVNIVAAVIALLALRTAMRPPDEVHHFGRGKAEYFSAQIEGFMILIAALVIMWTAGERLLHPRELEAGGIGLAISSAASGLNAFTAVVLMRAGRKFRSATLVADSRHLMTDVWTSVGVLVGVGLVYVTGYVRLDALVALAVGLNIIVTGVNLLRESTAKLLDKSLPDEDHAVIAAVLQRHEADNVKFHALQTREAGQHRFVSMHILVPGAWTIQQGHDLACTVEEEILAALPMTTVSTHVEPIEDERSWQDVHAGQFTWD